MRQENILLNVQEKGNGYDTCDTRRRRRVETEYQSSVRRLQAIILLIFLTFFVISPVCAQQLTPLSNETNRRMEYRITQVNPSYFTIIKPYLQNDSVFPKEYVSYRRKTDSWFRRKLLHESFVEIDSSDFYLFFDPAFDVALGSDNTGRKTFTNTRGFVAGGRLGKFFAFGTSFYENQAIFPSWVHGGIQNKIITGQGLGRLNNQTWDYAHSSGYISFSPIKRLNIQLGQGKNFIGDGYRSLLLSDVAYNYPYGRISYIGKRWLYSWMMGAAQDQSISKGNDQYAYPKRIFTSHLASFNAFRWLQLSIIKNTVYNNPDTTGKFTPGIAEFNPVMLPVETANSHSIWGLNMKISMLPTMWIYSQVAFDNLVGNREMKTAMQAGVKYFDAFGLKGLYLQGEFNQAEPSAYDWDNKTLYWLHYREPLAHPYGNNFSEGIFNVVYSLRRWQFNSFTRLTQQLNSSTGSNASGGFPAVTDNSKVLLHNSQINWYLNPKTTAHFSLGYIIHHATSTGVNTNSSFVYFAFRTALFNNYLYY